jgi:hypothetical protein
VLRTVRPFALLQSVIVLALALPACSQHDDVSTERLAREALPEIIRGGCFPSAAGEGWKNGFLPQQTGQFVTNIELYPNAAPLDAVVGISNGPADSFSDLAAIVRLNPDGFVDVRNGDRYMADLEHRYGAGVPVDLRVKVDIVNHVYDVDVELLDDTLLPLARGYRFRTEQSAVTRLDNAARILATGSGSFDACHFSTYRRPDPCLRARANGGWVSEAFPRQAGRFRVYYQAWMSDPHMDAVFGLSNGAPGRFANLAAIFRFNAQGMLDARDGGVYRADTPISYDFSEVFQVIMDVDVANHTYSVFVSGRQQLGEFVPLATNYRFRTEQASVPSLDRFGQFVEWNVGEVSACFFTVDYP